MRRSELYRSIAQCLVAVLGCLSLSYAAASPIVTPLADTSSASAQALVNNLLAAQSNLSVVAGSAQYTGEASIKSHPFRVKF